MAEIQMATVSTVAKKKTLCPTVYQAEAAFWADEKKLQILSFSY